MSKSKQYVLLRKILKALGLDKTQIEELVARIHILLTGKSLN